MFSVDHSPTQADPTFAGWGILDAAKDDSEAPLAFMSMLTPRQASNHLPGDARLTDQTIAHAPASSPSQVKVAKKAGKKSHKKSKKSKGDVLDTF